MEKEAEILLDVQSKVKDAKPLEGVEGARTPVDLDLSEVPWAWICAGVHNLMRDGAVSPPMMALLHGQCNSARSSIDQLAMMLNTQLPFAYSHLIAWIVHSSCILSAVNGGILAALAGTTLALCCRLLFFTTLAGLYLGLLTLSSVIADPFGDDVVDFPSMFWEQRMWKGCYITDARRYLPPGFYTPENQTGLKRPLTPGAKSTLSRSLTALTGLNVSESEEYKLASLPSVRSLTSKLDSTLGSAVSYWISETKSRISTISLSPLSRSPSARNMAQSLTPKFLSSSQKVGNSYFDGIEPVADVSRPCTPSKPAIKSPSQTSMAPVVLTPNGSSWTPLRRDLARDDTMRARSRQLQDGAGGTPWTCKLQVCVCIFALGLAVLVTSTQWSN
jgi:hypothetical protein